LLGGRVAVAGLLDAVTYAIFRGLLFMLLLAGIRMLVRRPVIASVLAGVAIVPLIVPHGAHLLTASLALGLGGAVVGIWVMVRYGLVSLVAALFATFILNTSPVTLDLREWYAGQLLAGVAVVVGLAIFGFVTAGPKHAAGR
jgi:hypothetical protein